MQVYKGMDIGTAKITKEEMQGIPHHLIDILEPVEEFNIHIFQNLCKRAISEIRERGHVPIICGGTGFYIQSVLYDIEFTEEENDMSYRCELEQLYKEKGGEVLYEMLRSVDPASCEAIHPNNIKRVIRALEYHKETGEKISGHNEEQRKKAPAYDAEFYVLYDERQLMYERIDRRVDKMIADGLVEEVRKLREYVPRDAVSMQGLGYKEIYAYLEGECSLEEAVYILKRDTRHFAKRQITWFKREKNTIWIKPEELPWQSAT
jgi:tRNA dimethylallyltransferase